MHAPTRTKSPILRRRTPLVLGLIIVGILLGTVLWHPWVDGGSLLRANASRAKLLVAGRAPSTNEQVAFIGDRFTLNAAGCVQWGSSLIVALPGSSIASDGKTVTLVDAAGQRTTYPLDEALTITIGGSPLVAGESLLPAPASECGPDAHIALVQ